MVRATDLTKARAVFAIIGSIIFVVSTFVTVLFFFFRLQSSISTIEVSFNKHIAEAAERMNQFALQKDLDKTEEAFNKHHLDHSKRFAEFVPSKELAIQFGVINNTLSDIKEDLNNCQREDKEFKEKIFKLMLEMQKNQK